MKPIYLLLTACFLTACASEPVTEPKTKSEPKTSQQQPVADEPTAAEQAEQDIKRQLAKLSTAEKVDQLLYIGISGTTLSDADRNLLNNHALGGVLLLGGNITSDTQLKTLTAAIKDAQDDEALAFLGFDEEGGRVSRVPDQAFHLPASLTLGQKDDPALMRETGQALGAMSRFYGFNMDFAPVLDVNSNPTNPIIGDRALSAEPDDVARLGVHLMEGIKSEDVVPVVKHFPGHGDTTVDSHVGLPTVTKTKAQLEQLELVPFKAAIDAGAEMVMVAHILFPALDANNPSSLSEPVMQQLLREELKFDGVIVTDDLVMGAITKQYGLAQAARLALERGADMAMFSQAGAYADVHAAIMQGIKDKSLSRADLDAKVTRVLRLKQAYDLADTKLIPTREQLTEQVKTITDWLN